MLVMSRKKTLQFSFIYLVSWVWASIERLAVRYFEVMFISGVSRLIKIIRTLTNRCFSFHCHRFPRQLQTWNSSVCRMLNMTLCWLECLQVQIPSDPRKSAPFCSQLSWGFSNHFSWTSEYSRELNLKSVQKLLFNTCHNTLSSTCQSLMSTSLNFHGFLSHKV